MHFSATAAYPASASAVAELFSTPEFVDAQIVASRATSGTHTITGTPTSAFTVTTVRTMPADLVPAQFRSFVSSGIEVTMTQQWNPPSADGSRSGELTVSLAHLPARAQGTCQLLATGPDSAELTYEGDLKVSVPIVGAKIERKAVSAVTQIMNLERDLALKWLSS